MRRRNFRTSSSDDVEVVGHKVAYEGFNRVHLFDFRVQSYDGTWIGPFDREVFERCDSVVVLPYDPWRDAVVMVEQVRFGAFGADEPYRQLEPVAGLIDTQESPSAIALREIREECGANGDMIEPVGSFLVSPGCLTETCHIYIARIDSSAVKEHCGERSEGEDIRVHVLPIADVERMIRDGMFRVAVSHIAIQWMLLNRSRIRETYLER